MSKQSIGSSAKLVAWAVALCMILGVLSPTLMYAQVSVGTDIDGHWAEAQIERWIERGIVKGYEDGTFKPENPIKRCEFAALMNRTFGFVEKAEVNFSDIEGTEWFVEDIAKAVAAGYMKGDAEGTFRPNDPIARQEAALVLARIYELGDQGKKHLFKDLDEIASWSFWAVMAVVDAGLMEGYPDGTFGPKNPIKRSETVTVLDRLVAEIFTEKGVYGKEDSTTTIAGNAHVLADGVEIQNTKITGDLLIAQSVGYGTVILDNVTVDGNVKVQGGGKDSIILKDSKIGSLEVVKKDVRIIIISSTQVAKACVRVPSTIVQEEVEGEGIAVLIIEELTGEGVVTISGNFEEIRIIGEGARVAILEGQVENLHIEAPEAIVELGSDATIANLVVDEPAEVKGTGSITNATINASGTVIEPEPENITIPEGVTAIIAGEEVVGGEEPVVPPVGPVVPTPPEEPDTTAPTLVSLTAYLSDGTTREAVEVESKWMLSWTVGETVTKIEAKVSEPVRLVDGAEAVVTMSGGAIPEGTIYGTVAVDPGDHTKVIITPNPGNETAALEEEFTFTVAEGVIEDLAGNKNQEVEVILKVDKPKLVSLTAYLSDESERTAKIVNDQWTLSWTVGETVTKIEAVTSGPVRLAVDGSTGAVVTMSGPGIREGTVYGTVAVDAGDPTKVIITPNAGNETAGLAGEFTFTVAEGVLVDIAGNGIGGVTVVLKVSPPIGKPVYIEETGVCYERIQAAVNAAAGGETIVVGAGTFTEAIAITDKSLTIQGTGGTVLTGGILAQTTTGGKSLTVSNITFNTRNLEVDGYDTVNITNNTFSDITTFRKLDGVIAADAIYVYGSDEGTVTIQGNTISGVRDDTNYRGDGIGITIHDYDDITIDGNTISDTWHNSINLYRGIAGEVKITSNTFSNWDSNKDLPSDGDISPGCEGGRAIRIDLAGDSISVEGNTFIPNDNELPVDPDYVKITGYTGNVNNLIYSLVKNNTWPSGTDYSIVILVNTTPGANMVASVISESTTNYYPTIQAAIDAANAGDTIVVDTGTFDEPLTINRPLTILGVNAENDPRTDAFIDEGSIVSGGIRITGGDVTLKGLTIREKGIFATGVSDLTVKNCRIEDIVDDHEDAFRQSPDMPIIGVDVGQQATPLAGATNSIVIDTNVFSNIGQENTHGMAIRIVRSGGNITITNNIIRDVTHNGINIFQDCLLNGGKLTIAGNEIAGWDCDTDQASIGGRAIRINFVGTPARAVAEIVYNRLIPPVYTTPEEPVDPQYVKIDNVPTDMKLDLRWNYWGYWPEGTPDFDTILLVVDIESKRIEDTFLYSPYYKDEAMTELGYVDNQTNGNPSEPM